MGEGERVTRRGFEAFPDASRFEIAEAMSAYDGARIAEALMGAVQAALSPSVALGFIVEPDNEVDVRQFVVDPAWEWWAEECSDFSWIEPLLARGAENGASIIGPPVESASQIAAVMDLGAGRVVYFLIVGVYEDPEKARRRLASIAGEAGTASQLIARSNERAADLAAHRERERLSRDLHDSLSQSLWSLSMLSETADSMIDPDDPLHAVIRQIADISLSSQEEMRGLLINLRSAEPSQDSAVSVLEALVADFCAGNDVEVVASIADADLDADTIMALRRIAEEALNNVERHASASKVAVLFDAEPVLTLRIADDGHGFDAKPVTGHLGLRVMSERAAEIDFEFDLASSPGDGTVVTVSKDLAAARSRPWSRPPPELPSKRSAFVFLVASIVCAAVALCSLFASGRYQARVESAQADLDVLAVLEQRVLVSRASADEATARIFAGVGMATAQDVATATTERSVAMSDAQRIAEPIADMGTVSGQYALLFLDTLSWAAQTDPGDQRLDQLYTEVDRMEGPGVQPTFAATTPMHSLGNLAGLNRVLTFNALEVITARYAMDPDAFETSDPIRSFFESYIEVVERNGGFFGPDSSMPFRSGVIPMSISMVHEGPAVDELNRIVVNAGLWEDDQWLQQWSLTSPPPPTSLESYVQRFTQASDDGRKLVDARFAFRSSELADEQESDGRRSQLFRLFALAMVVPALVALGCAVRNARRRHRATVEARTVDALTGLANREVLETEVVPMLRHPALSHHAMITLDMDRFALVNEVHGEEFGDWMLEVVAVGLQAVADHSPRMRGTAVRLGSDEFLVCLHSSAPIPADLADRAMNRLRSTLISAPDGKIVRCNFSYGVVFAEGSPLLGSLMTACDLALYEDKARSEVSRATGSRR